MLDRNQKRMAGEKQLSTRFEAELLHKSGRKILVESNTSVIQYEGKPADLVIMRDITERQQLMEKMLAAQDKQWLSTEEIPENTLFSALIFDRKIGNPTSA